MSETSSKQLMLLDQIQEALAFPTPKNGVLQGARKLRKGLPGKRVVFFHSVKNNALMPTESRLESANCLHLEFSQITQKYRTQPFKMSLHAGATYTPDFVYLDKKGIPTIQEVKFSGALCDPKVLSLHRKVRDICHRNNVNFHVVTEKPLTLEPIFYNLNYIYRGARIGMNELQVSSALNAIESRSLTLGELREQLQKLDLPSISAEHLIFRNFLDYDRTKKLEVGSLIWVRENK